MKTKNILTGLTACVLAAAIVGCSKSETPATVKDATDAAKGMAEKAADSAKDMTSKATEAVKDTAASAVAAVTNMVNDATGPFADGVASAKKMIADKNYQGALGELTKLSSMKLSDSQTKIVDSLKAEVQALIAKSTGGATDAVKGLLGK